MKWLGFTSKEGDKKDCYAVFNRLVKKCDFPKKMIDFLVIMESGLE